MPLDVPLEIRLQHHTVTQARLRYANQALQTDSLCRAKACVVACGDTLKARLVLGKVLLNQDRFGPVQTGSERAAVAETSVRTPGRRRRANSPSLALTALTVATLQYLRSLS